MTRPPAAWRPAPRHGVGPSAVALPAGGRWATTLDFLAQRLPAVSRADWQRRLLQGEVFDEQGRTVPAAAPYLGGQRLWYWRSLPAEPAIPFQADILFRDEHLLVVDKPHFLPMAPKGRYARETLLARLQHALGLDSLVPIHRLDRETAGLVVFSLRPAERGAYQALFRERQVDKVYQAVAGWRADLAWPLTRRSRLVPDPGQFMQMREVPGEPNAETRIELLLQRGDRALYRLQPRTGRTHQLRVHMNALGLPLQGDSLYPVLQPEPPAGQAADFSHPLQLLACELGFTDPVTGEARHFQSRRSLNF
jgi:tRNA pseudouridine32 synthase / 23S rRNA pseudouridine746 synthase